MVFFCKRIFREDWVFFEGLLGFLGFMWFLRGFLGFVGEDFDFLKRISNSVSRVVAMFLISIVWGD